VGAVAGCDGPPRPNGGRLGAVEVHGAVSWFPYICVEAFLFAVHVPAALGVVDDVAGGQAGVEDHAGVAVEDGFVPVLPIVGQLAEEVQVAALLVGVRVKPFMMTVDGGRQSS